MTNEPQRPDKDLDRTDTKRPDDDAERLDQDPTAAIDSAQTHWWDATSSPAPTPESNPSSPPTRHLHQQGDSPRHEGLGVGLPQDDPRPAAPPSVATDATAAAPAPAPASTTAPAPTSAAAPAPAPAAAATLTPTPPPERVRGPNAAAALLGLTCVVVAVLAIARETSGFTVDWGSFGPGAVIAAGGVLLLLGLVGLVRRKD